MDNDDIFTPVPENAVARKGENMARPAIPTNPVAGEAACMIDLDHEFHQKAVDTWALVQLAQQWGL